ncbi:hypothetical protein [uncultured Dysosmobacter sp.]|uniref:hypothetical protein n=1 Tax=uncultured Dysosmobacter sp. TaxID=2591384 RepID=UPI0026096026|nr:hypothetical protein [uncultured Dysosmobacter sp.]
MELVNILLTALLLLLLRKLVWCLRWLWRYYHGQEPPAPISFFPRRSGETFRGHLPKDEDEEE